MNNIYQESKDFLELIVRNDEMDNIQKRFKFEEMLEESASLVFCFHNDRDIFKYMQIPKCGKLAVNKISEIITIILIDKYKKPRTYLLNLNDIANDVFLEIDHYPSVQSCIRTDKDKYEFIKALAFFVARHILVHQYRMGMIVNKDMKGLVGQYLEMRNAGTGTYIGLHQISNKLLAGGCDPKEAMSMLNDIMWAKRDELARKSIGYNGGYLANQSKMLELDEVSNKILEFNFKSTKRKEKLENKAK